VLAEGVAPQLREPAGVAPRPGARRGCRRGRV